MVQTHLWYGLYLLLSRQAFSTYSFSYGFTCHLSKYEHGLRIGNDYKVYDFFDDRTCPHRYPCNNITGVA